MPDRSQVDDQLYAAMEYAFALHGRDARKASAVPYMTHLYSVCGLVLQDGGSLEQGIAALLHDALEDKPDLTNAEEIERRFGPGVLEIVRACTDTEPGYEGGPKQPWQLRKEQYLLHVRATEPELLRVSVADRVDNARAILMDHARLGEGLWRRFNAGKEQQKWYYASLLEAYEQAGVTGPLFDELRGLVK
jgi:(p)ppGpp synthase/HD superfamily hydrolase